MNGLILKKITQIFIFIFIGNFTSLSFASSSDYSVQKLGCMSCHESSKPVHTENPKDIKKATK